MLIYLEDPALLSGVFREFNGVKEGHDLFNTPFTYTNKSHANCDGLTLLDLELKRVINVLPVAKGAIAALKICDQIFSFIVGNPQMFPGNCSVFDFYVIFRGPSDIGVAVS
jgi:hypothetical protein